MKIRLLLLILSIFIYLNINLHFPLSKVVFMTPFLMFCLMKFIQSPQNVLKFSYRKKIIFLLAVFILLQIIGYCRYAVRPYSGIDFDSGIAMICLQIVVLIFAFMIFLSRNVSSKDISVYVKYINFSIVFFMGLNIFLYFLGYDKSTISNENLGVAYGHPSVMLSSLGINMRRVNFIFSSGINNSSIISGFCLLVGLFLTTKTGSDRKRKNFIGIFCISIGVIGILLCDSRAALFFAILTFICVRYCINYLPRILSLTIFIAPFIAVIMLFVSGNVRDTELGDVISRDKKGKDITTLTGRTEIWAEGRDVLSEVRPLHIVGYGLHGKFIASEKKTKRIVNKKYTEGILYSLHNIYLQYIFDIGYLGLIVLLVLSFLSIKRLISIHLIAPGLYADIWISFLLFILFYGNTEYTLPPNTGVFMIFIYSVIISALPNKTIERFRS